MAGLINYTGTRRPQLNKGRQIFLKNQRLYILFDFNRTVVDDVKTLPARTYDGDNKWWTAPINQENVNPIFDIVAKHGFTITPEAEHALLNIGKDKNSLLNMSRAITSEYEVDGLGKTLYPFQKAGVEYAIKAERTFMADDMGVGKTIQALATIQDLGAYPAVVITPASMKHKWAQETLEWLEGKRVSVAEKKQFYHAYIINGRMHMAPDVHNLPGSYDVVILNYDILKPQPNTWEVIHPMNMDGKELNVGAIIKEPTKPWKTDDKAYVKEHCKKKGLGSSSNGIIERLLDIFPKTLIIDESQMAKSGKSQRTRGLIQLSKKIQYRFALTGTPIMNRPSELISQLQILGRLEDFGGWYDFTGRYCDRKKGFFGNDITGSSNLAELHERLRATCFIRRTKAEVLPDLPTKQRVDIPIQITNLTQYKAAEKDLILWLKDNAKVEQNFLDTIQHMNQEAKDVAIKTHRASKAVKAEKALQLTRIEHLKGLSAKGKMDPAIEWIDNFLETDEKLIVFANHIEIQKALLGKYPDAARIMGEDDAATRASNVDRFQNSDCKIIICSLKAGSVGITLTAASNLVFLELGWTPAEHDQAEDRALRIGQENAVTAYYLIGEETIDLEIQDIIEAKRKVVNAATDGIISEGDDFNTVDELIERITK